METQPEMEALQRHIAAAHPLIMEWTCGAVGRSAVAFGFAGGAVMQPVRAIREATREEFLAHCLPPEAYLARPGARYFEFESD
jgi:hypothetical protein